MVTDEKLVWHSDSLLPFPLLKDGGRIYILFRLNYVCANLIPFGQRGVKTEYL